MSKNTKDLGVSDENDKYKPDYFGYYRCQVVGLLSQDEDFLPFDSKTSQLTGSDGGCEVSNPLFSNGIGSALSDYRKERLKALLRQGVSVLSSEVDEILHPVAQTSELLAQRRNRMNLLKSTGVESEDSTVPACKKLKDCSSSTERSTQTVPEQSEVNADVKLLLEDDNPELEKIMTKFSDELSARIGHMEKELEELLDGVMSSCRTMTRAEKKQLQKMIKALPPKDLNQVAELVQRDKPANQRSCDEVFVDLENESNVTLWRLYYYVQAVEKAKKLCHEV